MTKEELEKLKHGDIVINSENQRRIFLGVVKNCFITCHENGSNACDWELFECKDFSLPPKPKKRYWLWDVGGIGLSIYKCNIYLDNKGCTATGHPYLPQGHLIKKHENEFIEVDE